MFCIIQEDEYIIEKDSFYKAGPYRCEPDVSAACYFYAMAAVCGVCGAVFGVHTDSMQGDIEFLSVLRDMGCTVTDTDYGVAVSGPKLLKGIEVNMSDFSDQALTLAANSAVYRYRRYNKRYRSYKKSGVGQNTGYV